MESSKGPMYQRAVTPTIEGANGGSSSVKGKVLNYNSSVNKSRFSKLPVSDKLSGGSTTATRGGSLSPRATAGPTTYPEINVMGKGSNSARGSGSFTVRNAGESSYANDQLSSLAVLPRYDLVPLADEVPSDGIIFARMRSHMETLVVFRTPEERLRNPERLNLDRRQLDVCPLLEQEQRLRLLNFQNNNIRMIQNLENLPNLIFLDLYNNKIVSLEGPLSTVKGLRVLMAGKNKISTISNLSNLRKLDVLDLHSNDIRSIEGLESLSDLRVLNLAGNKINAVSSLSYLVSLTELNLRRNNIECVMGLNKLPALQRVFLSHNLIRSVNDIVCLFEVNFLIELSLDGNPISESGSSGQYRNQIIVGIPGLRHLDLKRITEEERLQAEKVLNETIGVQPLPEKSNAAIAQHSVAAVPGITGSSIPLAAVGKQPSDVNREVRRGAFDEKMQESPKKGTISLLAASSFRDEDAMWKNQFYTQEGSKDDSDSKDQHVEQALAESRDESEISNSATMANLRSQSSEQQPQQQAAIHLVASSDVAEASRQAPSKEEPVDPLAVSVSEQQGLASMARTGRLASGQSIFDLEIIGPDEKALIAVGDGWEWVQSKRMLLNVSEASLCHMRRETILHKFGAVQISYLPSLKSLRFVGVDFQTLKHIEFIPELFGTIEHLIIKDCPINSNVGAALLRSYLVASLSNLKSFNDIAVQAEERSGLASTYQPFLEVIQQFHPGENSKTSAPSATSTTASAASLSANYSRYANYRLQFGNKIYAALRSNGGSLENIQSNKMKATIGQLNQPAFRNIGMKGIDDNVSIAETNVAVAASDGGNSPNKESAQFQFLNQLQYNLTQSALYRRKVKNEFNVVFENTVKRLIKESLEAAVEDKR